jgi:ABC-type spermidine/putrescine transport system permease subunit I
LAANNWAFGAALSIVMTILVMVFLMIFGRWIGLRQMFLNR